MTLFTGLLTNASFSIFTISPWLLGIIAVVALVIALLLAVGRCEIIYVDPDGDYEIYHEKHPFLKKVQLHGASKSGKKLIGWSKKENGSKLVTKTKLRLTHTTELYAVWEELDQEGAVRVEINYMHADDEVAIGKDVFVLNTKLPDMHDETLVVNGWGFAKDGDVVMSKNDVEATFVIKLYPVFEDDAVDYANEKTNDKAVVDLLFSANDKNIYKESHYLTLNLPSDYEGFDNFIGWGFDPEGDLILDKTGADSIFTIDLCAVGEAVNAEPVAEETAVEQEIAPVEEPVQ